MAKHGYTIIELIVVITVIGILLSLGVVNFRNTQVTSRDQERTEDVRNFKMALETFYKTGYIGSTALNRYPSTDQLSGGENAVKTILQGFSIKNVIAPDASSVSDTLVMATNNTATTSGVTPQPTFSQYLYQPLTQTNALCNLTSLMCQKYNIYYRLEADNTVYMLQSTNQ